jgi:DNA-binding PadR family transcriptional regulator
MNELTPDDTLLGLLMDTPAHGYQLLAHFRDPAALGNVWNLSQSQLYAVLKRLEARGDIQGESITSPDAPSRNVFCVTDAGTFRLQAWLDEPNPSGSIRHVRVMFLSRLYIGRLLNQPTMQIVGAQKKVCHQRRQALVKERDHTEGGVGYLALELMIAQYTVILDWIDRCELIPRSSGNP